MDKKKVTITLDEFCSVFAKAMAIKMAKDPMSFLIMDELAEIGSICGNLLFKDEEKGEENGKDTERRN